MEEKKHKYLNPYLAGFALGVVLLFTFWVSGHGLGASGAIKNFVIGISNSLSLSDLTEGGFFSNLKPGTLWDQWIVIMFVGLIMGGFISGAVSNRLKFTIEKGPRTKNSTRLILAVIGGMLFGIGSQLGKGCTSGAALSGMAVMSASGIITMMGIFGTAFMIAFMFKRFWV